MLILQPFYYKDFECVGDKCLNTCCSGWNISIDKKSFLKYQGIDDEFGKRVRASVKRQDKNKNEHLYGEFILNGNKSCQLLNGDKLCDLYINKGESYLCKTCMQYPRSGFVYKNMVERELSATCPEIAKKLVFTKEKFSFDIEEDLGKEKNYFMDLSNINDDLFYNMLYESRNLSIDIVQIDKIPMWKRLIFVEFLEKRIQSLIDNNEMGNYQSVLNEFIKEMEYCIKDDSIKKVNTYIKHTVISIIMKDKDGVFAESTDTLNELFEGKEKEQIIKLLSDKENEFNEYFKDREYIYENYVVYSLFSNYMKTLRDKDLHKNVVITILDYAVLKILLFTFWLKHKKINDDDIAKVIWEFTRYMENSHGFLNNLYEWALENEVDRPAFLATLIY